MAINARTASRLRSQIDLRVLEQFVTEEAGYENLLKTHGKQIIEANALACGDGTFDLATEVAFHRNRLFGENKVATVAEPA